MTITTNTSDDSQMSTRNTRLPLLILAAICGSCLSLSSTLALSEPTKPPAPSPTPPTPAAPAVPAASRSIGVLSPKDSAQALPIKRITLYRSGVGFFERSGQISDSAEIQLRFNTEQINDILKSMVLMDLDGGSIDSVSYGSKEPLAKRLASFGINISGNPTIPDLLNQLRGAPIKVSVAGSEITGTILGIEQRQSPGGKDAAPLFVSFLNLVTAAGLRSVSIPDIASFEILDKQLSDELNKALGALAEYRADRTKTVDLRLSGAGNRRVVVGYVHEMPVWKSSYRLVLPELDSSGKTKGQLTMQGWAIVENTTDQDWTDVQLGLVSGRPMSFQMDLYEPLFSERPFVPVPTIPGVAPRIFALGVDEEQLAEGAAAGRSIQGITSNRMMSQTSMPAPTAAPMRARMSSREPGGSGDTMDKSGFTAENITNYSPRSAATTATAGEVFSFVVQRPVSIERQRSAMIPLLSTNITGRRVSIFNSGDNSQFPMRGVELTNDSALALLPGPISVFDGAAYAGDAQIGQIPKGDKRILAYALDLDVAVLTKPRSESTITKVSIVDGMVRHSLTDQLSTSYEIANKDLSSGRTVIVEHPRNLPFELIDTDKPSEITQDLLRFTVMVDAAKAKTFTVKQSRTRFESYALTGYDLSMLAQHIQGGKLSVAVKDTFRKVQEREAAIQSTERDLALNKTRSEDISKDQQRIRENMNSIDRNSELYRTYVSKLTTQETQVEELRDQRQRLTQQLETQRSELAAFLRNLNID